jgi:hypothetical protein
MIGDFAANFDKVGNTYVALGEAAHDLFPGGFGVDDDTSIPAELRNWLVRLRLLEGVPFANLVADSDLLPPESIRWFYLDRRWTDAIVQGALSVGTVNTDDRVVLTTNYPAIRNELDHEERNVRVGGNIVRRQGEPGPISGFILRSEAVSGWPGLHVRAFNVEPTEGDGGTYADAPEGDPRRIRLIRLDRLAPAVLLCLFDGVPRVVHIEEPRQGIQFGFDSDVSDSGLVTSTLPPRDVETSEFLEVDPVRVPFRGGASGVVDIRRLEKRLHDVGGTGADAQLDSGEYALQAVRFPWRQVFGDVEEHQLVHVFKPTVSYQQASDDFVAINPVSPVIGDPS